MKCSFLTLAAGLVFCLAACAEGVGPSEEDDIAAIKAIADTWLTAYNAGDIETLRTLYTDDAILMPRSRRAYRGVEEIMGFFAGGAAAYTVGVIDRVEEITVRGDIAWTVGRFWLDGVPKGEAPPFKDAGRYFILFVRDETGGWKIHRDIDQHTPDADPATPPE
ncbi:MAG: DUF4440 domain-containing protein [Sphingomonadales bacterium]|nr:DUF4440 domain-containing protein [Sphingomonadales bacterium]